MKGGEAKITETTLNVRDVLRYHNAMLSVKRHVWQAHPQCDRTKDAKRTDQFCKRKEDSLQNIDIMADAKFQLVVLPLELGVYTHNKRWT